MYFNKLKIILFQSFFLAIDKRQYFNKIRKKIREVGEN